MTTPLYAVNCSYKNGENIVKFASSSLEDAKKFMESYESEELVSKRLTVSHVDLVNNAEDIVDNFFYLSSFQQVLGDFKIDTRTLPMLPTKNVARDYVDYISHSEMNSPIMKYVDMHGRPALLFRLSGIDPETKEPYHGVYVLFKRYTDSIANAWGQSDNHLFHLIMAKHEKDVFHENSIIACPTCPMERSPTFLRSLLDGSNGVFNVE